MSNRDRAIELIEKIPDYKLSYIIPYLEGAALPEQVPDKIKKISGLDKYMGCGDSKNPIDAQQYVKELRSNDRI